MAMQPPSPLDAARAASGPFVLLYSSEQRNYSGTKTLLATNLKQIRDTLPPKGENWFGYLGYGMQGADGRAPKTAPTFIELPECWLAHFETITEWKTFAPLPTTNYQQPTTKTLHSNFTKSTYLKAIQKTIHAIHAGEFCQANITRKFWGTLAETPDPITLFEKLCGLSPSPYSALIHTGDAWILSSSPEQFLRISAEGHIESRPIKGSAARETDPALLLASEKNRAENLMIVDLMRNDFARVCTPGSITAAPLFELSTHATIHHLSSTVRGTLAPGKTAADAVAACFPPGSMTGAPKRRVMQHCAELENMQRGVYSGALGWFGADGSADLSVVIRTLILQGNRFEFQAGGGIVADSDPEEEWRESLIKTRAIATLLGISKETLAAL